MKIFYIQQNGILFDILSNFEIVNTVEEADKIVMTNDVLHTKRIVPLAKKQGKKTIIISHCFASTAMYLSPYNEFPISDKYLVWGDVDYYISKRVGINDITKKTGVPIFNHIVDKIQSDRYNIIFCPTRYCGCDVPINKTIYDELLKYDADINAKLLNCHDLNNYKNAMQTAQDDENHYNVCFDMLSKSDLVIVVDYTTTFALLSMSCDIPVIYVNDFGFKNYGCENLLWSGVYETSLDNLLETIDTVRKNDWKQAERKYWYEMCVYDSKNSVERICYEIEK